MTIQDLGALGELIGSVAVLATLIYLTLQTRQVYVDGEYVGRGTQNVRLWKSRNHVVTVRCGRYDKVTGHITRYRSEIGELDQLFGIFTIVNLAGLLMPGSWHLTPERS